MSESEKEIRRIKKVILEQIQSAFDFVPYELPEIYCGPREESGLLWRRFLLSDVRTWCGLSETDDPVLLSVLDDLAKRGKLKFFSIQLTRDMNHNDCGFACELGKAKRTLGYTDIVTTVERLYSKKPLTKREMKEPHIILNIRERVEQIRERRNQIFRQRFGEADLAIENKLYHEDLVEEAQYRNAIMTIAREIEERKAEEKAKNA